MGEQTEQREAVERQLFFGAGKFSLGPATIIVFLP
jgi:hypothetical protein